MEKDRCRSIGPFPLPTRLENLLMYFIPHPKRIEYFPGFCHAERGFCVESLDASTQSLAQAMLTQLDKTGIPIRLEHKPVHVPTSLAHHDLLAREAYRLTIESDAVVIDADHPSSVDRKSVV